MFSEYQHFFLHPRMISTHPLEECHGIFAEVFRESNPAVEDAPEEVLFQVPYKGGCSRQHLVHQHSQRPEVT